MEFGIIFYILFNHVGGHKATPLRMPMKKILLVLSLLAITGAGCASTPATQQTSDTNTTPAAAEQPAPVAPSTPTTTTTGATTTVKTSTGGEITYKTPAVKTAPVNSDDVPVTDIYLGEAQVKVDMEVGNFFFKPTVIKAKAGNAVQLTFTKVDGTHNFVIDGTNANFVVKQGDKDIFTAPSKPGSYPFYCSVGSHRAMGMVGTLIVE